VDFLEGKFRREQFANDLLALDDKQAQRFAVLFVAQRTETLEIGLGGHGRQRRGRNSVWQNLPTRGFPSRI